MPQKDDLPQVGVVIVSYNSEREIAEAIRAAEQQAGPFHIKVVVVDNSSKDGSVDAARAAGAAVVENKNNQGFAVAVNQGIKALKSDFYLILNPDAVLMPGSLDALYEKFRSSVEIGATGPNLSDSSGESKAQDYYLKAPSFLSVALFSTALRGRFINKPKVYCRIYQECGLEEDREVEQIPGACLFTSHEVLEKVGLLDEDFAIWFEDVEWCYRARKYGYRMVYVHNANVRHTGGVSFETWRGLAKEVTFYVSMKTFFKKHRSWDLPGVMIAITLNRLLAYFKSHDKDQLRFLKRYWTTSKGTLP